MPRWQNGQCARLESVFLHGFAGSIPVLGVPILIPMERYFNYNKLSKTLGPKLFMGLNIEMMMLNLILMPVD